MSDDVGPEFLRVALLLGSSFDCVGAALGTHVSVLADCGNLGTGVTPEHFFCYYLLFTSFPVWNLMKILELSPILRLLSPPSMGQLEVSG